MQPETERESAARAREKMREAVRIYGVIQGEYGQRRNMASE